MKTAIAERKRPGSKGDVGGSFKHDLLFSAAAVYGRRASTARVNCISNWTPTLIDGEGDHGGAECGDINDSCRGFPRYLGMETCRSSRS